MPLVASVDPAHLHLIPGADAAHLLLHEIAPNTQCGKGKRQKDWKADHDAQIVNFHDDDEGLELSCVLRALCAACSGVSAKSATNASRKQDHLQRHGMR